jgi:predicted small lipoprotein YifL
MKKLICLVLCAVMLFALSACGAKTETPAQETPAQETPATAEPAAEWTRSGYFTDENNNMLSVTWMEDIDEPGWYVGVMLGEDFIEDAWGGTLQQDGNTLRGTLPSSGSKDDLTVTVSEEGEDGILLAVEGGESYHFTAYDMPEATIFVTINTEGWGGMIGYEAGETVPELDPEWPYQSAQINLAEPETYTFAAAAEAGYVFIKWTKDGEDFSTEPVITVLLDESADFVAVFEEDPDWQNPVMNFIGEYQSGRAHALVECFDKQDAWITIEWGSSAWELARWDIVGKLDLDTLTIEYSGVTKSIVTYDDNGEVKSQEPEYEDGTGTVTFHNDGTFTWHEDQSEYGTDMVFEWVPPEPARQDGERFETTIILEGMEQTVQYEHIVSEALGFEMDYDYENFTRNSYPNLECFISVWDGLGNPENFLEVSHRAEDADTVAAAVREELSQQYDLLEHTRELDRAGECIYIEASVLRGTNNMADQLQAVYIIPAAEGCFVATARYAAEGAEGFGHRFNDMLQTFSAI